MRRSRRPTSARRCCGRATIDRVTGERQTATGAGGTAGGPPGRAGGKRDVETLHLAAQVVDDAARVVLVLDDSRRDEQHELRAVLVDHLVAEEPAEDRECATGSGSPLDVLAPPSRISPPMTIVSPLVTAMYVCTERVLIGGASQTPRRRARRAHLGLHFERDQPAGIDVRRHLHEHAGVDVLRQSSARVFDAMTEPRIVVSVQIGIRLPTLIVAF